VYDGDVRLAVVALVGAVDAEVLEPLDVRLRVAHCTTLEHYRLTDLRRSIARPLVDDWLVRVHGYGNIQQPVSFTSERPSAHQGSKNTGFF